MAYTVTTPSTIKPVSLDEMKSNMNLMSDFNDDDELIDGMISAAVDYAENYTRRSILTQTITAKCDGFKNIFELERSPVQSVTSIQYVDTDGATQTISSADYIVDTTSTPSRVVEEYNQSWPTARGIINAVTIVYIAGYSSVENVPDQIKQAIKILVGDWYKDRESYIVAVSSVAELPHTAKILLKPYQIAL